MNHISYRQEKKNLIWALITPALHPSISRGYMQWAHPHFLSMALWMLGLGYHVQPDLSNPTDLGIKKLIGMKINIWCNSETFHVNVGLYRIYCCLRHASSIWLIMHLFNVCSSVKIKQLKLSQLILDNDMFIFFNYIIKCLHGALQYISFAELDCSQLYIHFVNRNLN